MAKFLLLNEIQVANINVPAGRVYDDQYDDVVLVQMSGAQLLALPNASAEALAAYVQKQHVKGRTGVELLELFAGISNQAIMGGSGVPPTRTLTAGAGLTGGGDLSVDRTFDVVGNADGSITVNANDVQVGALATDAQHGARGGGTQHAVVVPAGAAGFMTGADKTKLDGIATGAAALTSSAPVNVTKSAAVVGVVTDAARADHKHDITTATAVDVGVANAEGVSTSLARADHVHNTPFSAVQTALGAATGSISVNSQEVTNGATPLSASSLATKGYVDTLSLGLDAKANCRLLSTTNIVLSGNQTIDGVLTTTGNRVYVIGQTLPVENGIWITAAGAWSRATDMAVGSSAEGVFAFVSEGTANADTGYLCTTNAPSDIVGTDGLTFAQFSTFNLATLSPADVTKAAAVIGTSGRAAREDHKHDVSTAIVGTIAVGDAAAEGTATSLARSDHTHALTAPAAPADVTKAAASAGAATTVARSDHKHDVSTAAPVDIGSANAEGAATSLARSNHVHNLTSAVAKAATASGFTVGSIPFVSAGPSLSEDNTALFWNAANDQLGIGTNTFSNVREKIRMAKPAGDAYARFDGALAVGVTDASVLPDLNSASQFLSFVVGSQLDMDQFGFGNAGLYACARTGPTPGSPPTLAPFTGMSLSDNGTLVALGDVGGGRSVYVGGGGWGAPSANDFSIHTAPTYTETVDTDVLRFHINSGGRVAVGSTGATLTESLFTIDGVGSGSLAFRQSSTTANSRFAGSLKVGADSALTAGFFFEQNGAGGSRFARTLATTGAASNLTYVGAAHTGQTASTETPDVDIDGSATLQHATGALATQRQFVVRARTYSFVAASTITDAATLAVTAAPVAGTNATITNSYALWVQAGKARFQGALVEDAIISPTALSGTTNDYAPTGLATTRIIRQDCSAAAVLTGLLALQGGQRTTIFNIATNVLFTLTLNNEDAGSTAANRFVLPTGAALVIPAGGSVDLWYDPTSARWRALSSV